jgi:hypothetical protein
MALISIYEYWENSCRSKLALFHGVELQAIKSEIFGDLRKLRNPIIHHGGVALEDVEKCTRFRWYKKNDSIFIDGEQLEEIIISIKASGDCLYAVAN